MFSQTRSFENKNALIVGGSSGIGKEAALALGRQGAKVTVLGRRFKHNRDVDQEWKAIKEFKSLGADLYDFHDVEYVMRKIDEQQEPFDYLVNSAGTFAPKPFIDHST